jgi:hypothetical protein
MQHRTGKDQVIVSIISDLGCSDVTNWHAIDIVMSEGKWAILIDLAQKEEIFSLLRCDSALQ